jgi:predicted transcriptional regulator
MNLVKDEAKRLIEKLPDTATWDDIMYELYVKKKIAVGLKAADDGRVVSHEEAKKRLLTK